MLGALSILMLATAPANSVDSLFAHLPEIHAVRLSSPIAVDGLLDEPAWQQAAPITNFTQSDPVQGAAPSERTEVRLAYDDHALYVAARLWDDHPDSIVARLCRRDTSVPSDRFSVFLDPFHDKRNGYYFQVNASGSRNDGTLFNNDWDESSWDGVWQGRAHIDDKGWTAEVRIPFSQLRFRHQDRYLWGVNFRRDIPRHNERDWLVFTPHNTSGFVSRFPDLVGLEHVEPGRYFEVLPYSTSRAEQAPYTTGDPFNDGSSYQGEFGGDLRTGIGSNLTLNATVNPDFGQVDVDPAVVNLSDAETFYDEKRPFFVEGNTIYNFGNQGATDYWGFNWQDPKFFYTRRIGRAPQGSLPDAAEFTDVPTYAKILGAGKITGRLPGDWNVGSLHALTGKVEGDYSIGGASSSATVEPLTYYGVARTLRSFHHDRQGLGVMGTLALRRFEDPTLPDELNRASFMGGLDGWTFLDKDKTWVISGWSAMSHVSGTEARMQALQQNPQHYFQRPDSRYLTLDSAATSLSGFGTRLWLNKQNGRVISNSAIGFMSPRMDVNDMGFQGFSGVVNAHAGLGYSWTENGRFKKYSNVLGAVFASGNFDGDRTNGGLWARSNTTFTNLWYTGVGGMFQPRALSDRATRGGPLMMRPAAWNANTYVETNSNGRLYYFMEFNVNGDDAGGHGWSFNPGLEWKPVSSLSTRIGPNLSRSISGAQYVGQYADPLASATYGKRYLFANLDQTAVSADVSANWSFTPGLSFQLYAQPLIASGKYTQLKELSRPSSYDFLVYGTNGSTIDENTWVVDPDGSGPAASIDVGKQDFNYLSLRGNAVLRWEYRPGSTFFLVWTQSRSSVEDTGDFDLSHSTQALTAVKPTNIFLVKLTYYLGL